jgi:hypothetical protein
MAIDSSVLLMVQTYSRDRGNRIYGHKEGYRKATEVQKFKGFKAVDLAFKRGEELHIAVKPFKNGFNVRGVGDAARP